MPRWSWLFFVVLFFSTRSPQKVLSTWFCSWCETELEKERGPAGHDEKGEGRLVEPETESQTSCSCSILDMILGTNRLLHEVSPLSIPRYNIFSILLLLPRLLVFFFFVFTFLQAAGSSIFSSVQFCTSSQAVQAAFVTRFQVKTSDFCQTRNRPLKLCFLQRLFCVARV